MGGDHLWVVTKWGFMRLHLAFCDVEVCGSDAREAWALGISARGLFGLWRGMELVAAFSEGARVKTNPSQTGLTLTISSAASASFTSVYLADLQAYSQAYV